MCLGHLGVSILSARRITTVELAQLKPSYSYI